ncbi:hypothetical protein HZB60_02880 [candidate division KSB1 bacterium]|nr:hypothetical protein [candidate division KSB1 bacterium]
MKPILILALMLSIVAVSCVPKRPEAKDTKMPEMPAGVPNPHATPNPHGADADAAAGGGGVDIAAMLGALPEGWKSEPPASNMRLGQVVIPTVAGDQGRAEIAIFHFPGSGGSSSANIQRWQGQMTGPKGEPGASVAKTDTLKLPKFTVITTDVTGTLLASTMGTGPSSDVANSRMIASVIETPAGNWFVKATGPIKTIAAAEPKFREWVKNAKLKG